MKFHAVFSRHQQSRVKLAGDIISLDCSITETESADFQFGGNCFFTALKADCGYPRVDGEYAKGVMQETSFFGSFLERSGSFVNS